MASNHLWKGTLKLVLPGLLPTGHAPFLAETEVKNIPSKYLHSEVFSLGETSKDGTNTTFLVTDPSNQLKVMRLAFRCQNMSMWWLATPFGWELDRVKWVRRIGDMHHGQMAYEPDDHDHDIGLECTPLTHDHFVEDVKLYCWAWKRGLLELQNRLCDWLEGYPVFCQELHAIRTLFQEHSIPLDSSSKPLRDLFCRVDDLATHLLPLLTTISGYRKELAEFSLLVLDRDTERLRDVMIEATARINEGDTDMPTGPKHPHRYPDGASPTSKVLLAESANGTPPDDFAREDLKGTVETDSSSDTALGDVY